MKCRGAWYWFSNTFEIVLNGGFPMAMIAAFMGLLVECTEANAKTLSDGVDTGRLLSQLWNPEEGRLYTHAIIARHNRMQNTQWYKDNFELESLPIPLCCTDVLMGENKYLDETYRCDSQAAHITRLLTSKELDVLFMQKGLGQLPYGAMRHYLREKGLFSRLQIIESLPNALNAPQPRRVYASVSQLDCLEGIINPLALNTAKTEMQCFAEAMETLRERVMASLENFGVAHTKRAFAWPDAEALNSTHWSAKTKSDCPDWLWQIVEREAGVASIPLQNNTVSAPSLPRTDNYAEAVLASEKAEREQKAREQDAIDTLHMDRISKI